MNRMTCASLTSSPLKNGIKCTRAPRTFKATSKTPSWLTIRPCGAIDVYNLAGDMGGMGFIENNKALCMLSVLINTQLLMARQGCGRRTVLLFVVGLRLQRRQATREDVDSAERRRRLSGDARRRLRLGKAFLRAHVPPLPRGLRPLHSRGPFPQRLRPARHLGRRTRESARRDLPQGDRGQAHRQTRDRDLGRRQADPQLHVHRRLPARASTRS